MLSSSKIALAFAIAVTSAQPAFASGENIIGGIIGIGGALIINEISKGNSQKSKRSSQQRRQLTEAQRAEIEEKKEIQRRLNTLGFDTGKPDGKFGPKTRRAVSAFQSSVGAAPTGTLSQDETVLLYQQSANGGAAAASFPTLAGQSDQSATPTVKFPSLGGKQVEENAPASFPTLGGQSADQKPEAASFPTIADRPDPAIETTKFPPLAAPISLNSKLTEEVTIAKPTGKSSIEELLEKRKSSDFSLEVALLETQFKNVEMQPKILGVALGDSVDPTLEVIATAGFEECRNDMEELQWLCSKQTASFIDTIQIDVTSSQLVWNISRQLVFNEPLEISFLKEKFQTAYGDLTASKMCADVGLELVRSKKLMAQLSSIQTLEKAEESNSLANAAISCPVVFDVHIPGVEMSGQVDIHFSHLGANVQRWLDHKEHMRVDREKKLQDISAELAF